ncbi:unnamed protein product [Protopolystoma xenopodis]|uniref:Kinesin motor domain-containing protein n=1 Tax=Protopolystoma xenopodis TaxID=117903 RepID=A0A3S5BR27_9PLAT|nr:unnamed protein product [Protopolystoma xenopodis]
MDLLPTLTQAQVGLQKRLSDTKALYRQEVQTRRILYNTLIELRGNIRVFCRIRPSALVNNWLAISEDHELIASLPNSSTKRRYQFDEVFTSTSTQEDVSYTYCL